MENLFNSFMELALWGSLFWFCAITVIYIIFIFSSELSENGYVAAIASVIFMSLLHSGSNVDLLSLVSLKRIGGYLGVGFLYALYRVFLYGRERGREKIKTDFNSQSVYNSLETFNDQTLNNVQGNVLRWWFLWPVSFIVYLFDELLGDLWGLVWSKLKGIFYSILFAGERSVTKGGEVKSSDSDA